MSPSFMIVGFRLLIFTRIICRASSPVGAMFGVYLCSKFTTFFEYSKCKQKQTRMLKVKHSFIFCYYGSFFSKRRHPVEGRWLSLFCFVCFEDTQGLTKSGLQKNSFSLLTTVTTTQTRQDVQQQQQEEEQQPPPQQHWIQQPYDHIVVFKHFLFIIFIRAYTVETYIAC